jgi:transcriptional regulator with XRE-family HTH domain
MPRKPKSKSRRRNSRREKLKSTLPATLGERARSARRSLGFTQDDVAERVALSTEFYGRIERGTSLPSVVVFERLCRVLAVRPNVLLGLDEPQPRSEELIRHASQVATLDERRLRRTARAMRDLSPSKLELITTVLNTITRKRR